MGARLKQASIAHAAAGVAAALGEPDEAAILAGSAPTLLEQLAETDRLGINRYACHLEAAKQTLGDSRWGTLCAEGRALSGPQIRTRIENLAQRHAP
jgi:hypothetical protein